ncbi:MAG: glycosyltransferase family 4 protein [Alphaproteobacteria bacterium]|nr:glycosyltransferase family 4 protein [Alphaproteobacteria bacterium]
MTHCPFCEAASPIAALSLPLKDGGRLDYQECETCGTLAAPPPPVGPMAGRFDVVDVERPRRRLIDAFRLAVCLTDLFAFEQPGVVVEDPDGLTTGFLRDAGLSARRDGDGSGLFDRIPGDCDPTIVFCLDGLDRCRDPAALLARIAAFDADIVVFGGRPHECDRQSLPERVGFGRRWLVPSRDGLQRLAERWDMRLFTAIDLHVLLRNHPKRMKWNDNDLFRIRYRLHQPRLLMAKAIENLAAMEMARPEGRHDGAIRPAVLEGQPSTRPRMARPVQPAPIVIDGVFFQLYRTGIARVWASLLKIWNDGDFAKRLLVLDRGGTAPRFANLRYRLIGLHEYEDDMTPDRRQLERVCRDEGAALFASTYYTSPLTIPSVQVVYDMIPEVMLFGKDDPMWVEKRTAIARASRFVCISENTRKDLNAFHPHTVGRTEIAYPGIDPLFRVLSEDERAAARDRLKLEKPFYLLPTSVDGYKNGRLLLDALRTLPELADRIIVVTVDPGDPALFGGLDVRRIRGDDTVLRDLYNCAVATVYPSAYEGFGMPIGEAMACGCPVIASMNDVSVEVGGNAALYVNPTKADSMAKALRRLEADPALRQTCVARGLERPGLFRWEDMAATIRRVLEEAAG